MKWCKYFDTATVHANIRVQRWGGGRNVWQNQRNTEEDGKGETNTIIVGDCNSVTGEISYQIFTGPHGQGRNHRCQMFIVFHGKNKIKWLVATSTWLKKHKTWLYTWKAPGAQNQNQLDYILVKHPFRNSMKDVQTLSGAVIDPNHNLLAVEMCTRLKKVIRFQKDKQRWDVEKLYAHR